MHSSKLLAERVRRIERLGTCQINSHHALLCELASNLDRFKILVMVVVTAHHTQDQPAGQRYVVHGTQYDLRRLVLRELFGARLLRSKTDLGITESLIVQFLEQFVGTQIQRFAYMQQRARELETLEIVNQAGTSGNNRHATLQLPGRRGDSYTLHTRELAGSLHRNRTIDMQMEINPCWVRIYAIHGTFCDLACKITKK